MTVCRPRAPLLPRPRHQPAQPQHQGSREALPRHRLSLRCQELWMRLRASSNFFLEASWMALCGRSTCVGHGRNLRAVPRALREPRGPSAPGVTLPRNQVHAAEKGGLQPTGRCSLSFLLPGVHQLLGVGAGGGTRRQALCLGVSLWKCTLPKVGPKLLRGSIVCAHTRMCPGVR